MQALIESLIPPIVGAVLSALNIPDEIAKSVARIVPRIIEHAKALKDEGADIDKQLDIMLDSVELAVDAEADKKYGSP